MLTLCNSRTWHFLSLNSHKEGSWISRSYVENLEDTKLSINETHLVWKAREIFRNFEIFPSFVTGFHTFHRFTFYLTLFGILIFNFKHNMTFNYCIYYSFIPTLTHHHQSINLYTLQPNSNPEPKPKNYLKRILCKNVTHINDKRKVRSPTFNCNIRPPAINPTNR